jgi:hypothetical protein
MLGVLIFAGEVLGDAEAGLEAEGRLQIETVAVSIWVDRGLGARVGRLRLLGQVLSGCAGKAVLAGRSGVMGVLIWFVLFYLSFWWRDFA